jgi:HK97 family phage major capsid protein
MVSPDALSKITSFRDSQNMPIFQPGWGGQPATLMGRPVYENPAMAAVASASKSVMFGQLDRYVIARVNPLRVEVSNEYKWSTDQISCRVLLRADGALVDTDAVKLLISANT